MTGVLQTLIGGFGAAAAAVTDAYFYLVTLLLPGNGTNGAQNNTFLDSGTANGGVGFTITRNPSTGPNAPTQGTFSPFSQTGWSNYFDGSSVLSNTTTTSTGFNLSTGSFTIEAWVYVTAITAYQYVVSLANTAGNDSGLVFGLDNTGKLYIGNGVVLGKSGSTAISANSWTHIAVVSDGTNIQFYTNGTANGSAQAFNPNTAQYFYVGRSAAGSNALTGYISNVRVTKGQQLYTGAFTPSTSALTTTSQGATATNVHLLTCQSNRFVDNGTNTFAITVTGTPSVQAFSPFAPTAEYSAATVGGSGFFDGSGDYLTWGSGSSVAFGTGDFTVEAFVYVTSTPNTKYIVDARDSSNTGAWAFAFGLGGTGYKLGFFDGTTTIEEATASAQVNAWQHCVAVRSGTTLSVYLNGSRVATATNSKNLNVSPTTSYVGTRYTGSGYDIVGYISTLRIVKGTAVYDPTQTTLTIPTAPLTAITNTQLLLNFTNAGITDATAKNDLETVGNAQISTTQSKFGGSSMYFDGTGDNLRPNSGNIFNFGTGDFTVEFWLYLNSTGNQTFIDCRPGSAGDYMLFDYNSNALRYYVGSTTVITGSSLSTGQWYHIALSRISGTARMFINGTQTGSTATHTTNLLSSSNPYIASNYVPGDHLNGYIDDLRITKGYARYTANFTAPTAALPLQ